MGPVAAEYCAGLLLRKPLPASGERGARYQEVTARLRLQSFERDPALELKRTILQQVSPVGLLQQRRVMSCGQVHDRGSGNRSSGASSGRDKVQLVTVRIFLQLRERNPRCDEIISDI